MPKRGRVIYNEAEPQRKNWAWAAPSCPLECLPACTCVCERPVCVSRCPGDVRATLRWARSALGFDDSTDHSSVKRFCGTQGPLLPLPAAI